MEVVVLIPGLMGSELYHPQAGKIWPVGLLQLFLPYRHRAELNQAELQVGDIVQSVGPVHIYDTLIDDLQRLGYAGERLVIFPYDWRRDNALAARQLGARLREVMDQLGPSVTFDIVAHSMGGLVARYFLEAEDGELDTSARARVGRVIFLGTPHRGAPMALTAALGEEPQLFLSEDDVRELVNNPSLPAVYQLLPSQRDCFVWDGAADSRERRMDIWNGSLCDQLGLTKANLAAAQAFHAQLDVARAPAQVEYFSFFGTRHVTMNHVQLVPTGSAFRTRRGAFEDAGDGTVPVWSGCLSGTQAMPVGGAHTRIFADKGLRSTLAALLGRPDVLAATTRAQLALVDTVITAAPRRQTIDAGLTLARPSSDLRGRLWWERASLPSGVGRGVEVDEVSEPSYAAVGIEQPLELRGPKVEHIRLELAAPPLPGCYRLCFAVDDDEPIRSGELVVQERTAAG